MAQDLNVTLIVRPQPEAQITAITGDFAVTVVAGVAGPPGIGTKGDKGDQGPSHSTYEHPQPVPVDDVIVTHGLGRRPSVTVVDSGGSVVEGDYEYLDDNRVHLTFSAPFSFTAYFN